MLILVYVVLSLEPVVKRLKSDSDSENAVDIEPKFTQDTITDKNNTRGSALTHLFPEFKVNTSLFIVFPKTFLNSLVDISNVILSLYIFICS